MLLPPEIRIFAAGGTWIPWETIWSLTKDVNLGRRKLTNDETIAWKRVSPNTQKLIRMTGNAGQRKESRELLEILRFSANACYEPRDKVYGLMSLFEMEDELKVDYNKSVFDVFVYMVMAFHNIIKFDYGRGYVQWLDVTQKVGVNMGIDSEDVAALFAFLELVLPVETYNVRQNRNVTPTIVSTIGAEIRWDTIGLHSTSQATGHVPNLQSSRTIDAENRAVIERATITLEKSLVASSMPSISIDAADDDVHVPVGQDGDHNRGTIGLFEYNFIEEVFRYYKELRGCNPLHNKKRWDFTTRSITELVSLQEEGIQLSWHHEHEGRKHRYKRPPGWQYIVRLPPLTMARIMRQCGKEGSSSTDATPHQRRKLGKKAAKRVNLQYISLCLSGKQSCSFS